MDYQLGVDLGTTFTAAALARDGRVEVVSLGDRTLEIPSVAYAREDGELLVGEVALRRGVADPTRFAREFKRRLGDPTPTLLGGVPYSAEALLSAMLQHVVREVSEREGGPPAWLTLTLPANWGPYKRELFDQMIRLSDLANVSTATEPAAAAVHFASTTRVAPGEVIALYDLGGGTFDAAVLRKVTDGFQLLGAPEGIEHLGGVDFDEAVFGYVMSALRQRFDDLSTTDQAFRQGVVRLRQERIDAKQALSGDTEASIAVALPAVHTEIRLTRPEFEDLVRPLLQSTVAALGRALRTARVTPAEVKAVVLAGGSSRIPLMPELIQGELGAPVTISSHPKHAVALGAALLAQHDAHEHAARADLRDADHPDPVPVLPPRDAAPGVIWAPPVLAPPDVPAVVAPPVPAPPVPAGPSPVSAAPPVATTPVTAEPDAGPVSDPADHAPAAPAPLPTTPYGEPAARRRSARPFVIAGVGVAVVAAAIGVVALAGGDGGGGEADGGERSADVPAAMTLTGHTDDVRAVAFSPDGTTLASGGADDIVRLWNVETGEETLTLSGHEDWVQAVAFSPDGATVASASDDATVRLWDVASGEAEQTLSGHDDWVSSVAFSPDGATVASAGNDTRVRLWDVAAGEEISYFGEHESGATAVAFSPAGDVIASAADDGTAYEWDPATGEVAEELPSELDSITALAFAPDGATIALTTIDGVVALWTPASDDLRELDGHNGEVLSVAFAPDGQTLASAGADGTVRLWDADSGDLLGTDASHGDVVESVAFSPDGELVASVGHDDVVRVQSVAELEVSTDEGAAVAPTTESDDTTPTTEGSDDTTADAASDTTVASPSPNGGTVVAAVPGVETSGSRMVLAGDVLWIGGNYDRVARVDVAARTAQTYDVQGTPVLIGSDVWILGEEVSSTTATGEITTQFEATVSPQHSLVVGDVVWSTAADYGVILDAPTVGAFGAEAIFDGGAGALVEWGGTLWMAGPETGQLMRFDPSRFEVVDAVDLGGTPTSLARYGPYLWIGLEEGAVVRYDPATGAQQRIELGLTPGEPVTYAGALWYADVDGEIGQWQGFARVDVNTLAATTHVTGESPVSVYAYESAMWVTNEWDGNIAVLDAATVAEISRVELPEGPTGVGDAGGGLLAVRTVSDSLVVVQPGTPPAPASLVVTIDGAGARLAGPVVSPELLQAVQTAVTEVMGAPPADGTGGPTGGVPGVVRVVGDGTVAQGDRAVQLDGVAARLEAAGLYVDREYQAADPPSVVSIESLLNAIFADSSVFFASGSAELSEESYGTLEQAAEILNSVPFASVEIEGHTDADGDDASNQVLSEQRAEAVREYLASYMGDDGSRLTAVGYGESRPIADNGTEAGKARNRRIQFRISGLTPTGT